MTESQRLEAALDFGERVLESYGMRFFLSLAIIVSVLPEPVVGRVVPAAEARGLDDFFLAIFVPEFLFRTLFYVRRWRERRASIWEPPLLLLDLLAIVSFLPLQSLTHPHYFRLFRLTRMLLLLGYWGGMVRQLWEILSSPDRRHQVIMVLFLGIVLSFGSTVLLFDLAGGHDFNGDGKSEGFFEVMWWSFRQIQDPGNLVPQLDNGWVVAFSVFLTFAGLLLFSFVIGIGTGAVEELMQRSRERPLAIHGHTVVLGLGPYSRFLLEGLAEIYRKNLRPFRAAVLGTDAETPAFLHQPSLRSVRYRTGQLTMPDDLDRVNLGRAKRAIILGSDPQSPDTEVISILLASRERSSQVPLFPDLEHERNFRAALVAGGAHTHLVGSGSFLGYYIAQNVVYPGCHRLYRQLLTTSGCEVYTYVFSEAERAALRNGGSTFDPAVLYRHAYRRWGVSWIGLFAAEDPAARCELEELDVILNPVTVARRGGYAFDAEGRVRWPAVRGLVGFTVRWEDMRRMARSLVESPHWDADATDDDGPAPAESSGAGSETRFATLALRPPGGRVERVLICGASLRVPRVVAQLAGFHRRIRITVALPETERFEAMERGVRAALEDAYGAPEVERGGDGVVRLRISRAETDVHVDLLTSEWDDHQRLLDAAAVTVETADAILFLPGARGAAELDGEVALDCLGLANLEASGAVVFRDGLRVIGMVRDPLKVQLLESRLRAVSGGRQERFVIISSEHARHSFIMQNVFVWGLNPVFLRLLSFSGHHLARLEPTIDAAAGASFDPWELASHLLSERGEVFVGLELDDGEVLVDPREMRPGTAVAWASVRALYVLGDERC